MPTSHLRTTRPSRYLHRNGKTLPCPQPGFALVIALTLMAFVLLLLLSMATLLRVETSAATSNQQMAMARQNALMGLHVALGELQKYAGPDQRSTARADIINTNTQNGTLAWTGVWANANNPQADFTSDPVLLQWLVSGNQNLNFNPASHVSHNASSFGQITQAPSNWSYNPDDSINGLSDSATIDSSLTIDGTQAALLVGPGTTGTDASSFVLAPLVTIPGSNSSGHYAYWIGDEGVKARANLADPYILPTEAMQQAATTAAPDSRFRLMAPQRTGTERITGYENYPANSSLARLIHSNNDFELADSSLHPQDRRAAFHHITTTSSGVLADSLHGGLKQDLTQLFALDPGDFQTALGLSSPVSNPLIPSLIMPANENGPTWEQLHAYANLDGSLPVSPLPHTPTTHGVHPVLIQARLFFAISTLDGATEHQQQVLIHIYPAFVIANPYNAPIAAADYHVRVDFPDNTPQLGAYLGSRTPANRFWRKPLREVFEGQVFVLDSPQLEPGEARIFTMASAPNDEDWEPLKFYTFENDWAGQTGSIVINAGFPATVKNQAGTDINATPRDQHGLFQHPEHLPKHGLEGIAGWLSQADVIQALAPAMTARSDTFRIRSYGDTRNPITGRVEARAWCEAIVQRQPDYLDPTANDALDQPDSLAPLNRDMGRRFVILSFRWLDANEI